MIELLQVALVTGTSNQQRKQAENKIVEYRASQPVGFLKEAMAVFASDTNLAIRQGAYALLRRSFTEKTVDGKILWDMLSAQEQLLIKNQLLNTLINQNRVIKRSSADVIVTVIQLIATICNVELPLGKWPEIVSLLTNNTKNQNQDISLSAIMTLGSLCQLMKERGTASGISTQQIEAILTGLLFGLHSPSAEIRDTSIKAVGDSMEFVKPLMSNPQYRQFTFNQLIKVREPSPEQTASVLKTLADFVRVNYIHLAGLLEAIFNLTMPLIKIPKNEKLCQLAMEVWDTLATQYNELKADQKVKNYLDKSEALIHLTDALLNNLLYVSNDEEDIENSVRGSAYRTLYSIGMICADQIFNKVLAFVSQNIGHSQWKHRQASLRAFCTLLQGADNKEMGIAVTNGLLEFLRLLDDNSSDVQYNAAFCLNKIAEFFPQCFTQHKQFAEILDLICKKLSRPPNISIELCNIFVLLTEHTKDNPSQILNQSIEMLSNALVVNAFRNDITVNDLSLADRSFVAAMALINNTTNGEFCLKYIPLIMGEFPKTYTLQNQKRAIIQNGLLTLVHSCLMVLESSKKKFKVEEYILESIYSTVIGHFKKINDVTSDGLYVLGSLSAFKPVPAYLESVQPFVKHGLAKLNDHTMFKAGLGCLVDLARNNPATFGQPPYITIIAQLLKALRVNCLVMQMPEIDKELKLMIFSCIGDVIIFIRGSTVLVSYLKELMDILVMGYQGSIHMAESQPEYAQSLRQVMVDTTTCVVHTLESKDQSDQIFRGYIKNIFEFVTVSMQLPQKKLTMEFVETSLMMLIDILNYYKKEIAQLARAPILNNALGILDRNNRRGKYTNSIAFAKQVILQTTI